MQEFFRKNRLEQAGAELGKAQFKLKAIAKVVFEVGAEVALELGVLLLIQVAFGWVVWE